MMGVDIGDDRVIADCKHTQTQNVSAWGNARFINLRENSVTLASDSVIQYLRSSAFEDSSKNKLS